MRELARRLRERHQMAFWRDWWMEQSAILERSRDNWRAEVWFWRNLAELLS